MNLTDEEIELVLEWRKARDAFVATKRKKGYRDTKEYDDAAKAMNDLRTKWRQIGEAAGTRTPIAPIKARKG